MPPSWRHTKPYAQQYRTEIAVEYAGLSLGDFFTQRFSFYPRKRWEALMADRKITVNRESIQPDYILKLGDIIHSRRDDVQEPDVRDDYEVLYEQDGFFIINKPAPLPVHPAGRYYKNSLSYILQERFPDKKFHTIHRLDLWTTGVLLMATDPKSAGIVHHQIDKGRVQKIYGVLAMGDFPQKEFTVDKPIGRLNGNRRGVGNHLVDAKPAVTRFTVMAKTGDVTFLKAEPITGRTNQIRVHLQSVGCHVLGDPLYGESATGDWQPATDFMGLHCREMRLKTAHDQEQSRFVAPWPGHFKKFFDSARHVGALPFCQI